MRNRNSYVISIAVVLIVFLSLLPNSLLMMLYSFFARLIDPGIVLSVSDNIIISNVGHLVAFFLLTVSSLAALECKLWKIVVAIFSFSLLTELSQYFISTRSSRLEDVAYNLAGIVAGLCLAKVWPNSRENKGGIS